MEQLGPCFPGRFPQEMLSDLAQSEALQRRFCLFRLQEWDRRLLEPGPAEVRGKGRGEAEPPPFPAGSRSLTRLPRAQVPGAAPGAGVAEVKVLALSPRCWPVSPLCHMENPARFFPAPLSSPLEEFADFCRQSE